MTDTRHLTGKEVEYIARSSHGKDSLKMLDVIVTRGLLLDRITTTDIWATDTLRGEHPLMVKHKEKVDDFIWKRYRIEVEHLCAMKNGKKVTYEKMFYHVPKRKEREKHQQGTIFGWPTLWVKWCQSYLKREATEQGPRFPCTNRELVQETQNRIYTGSRYQSIEPERGAQSSKRVFGKPRHEGQEKYRGVYRHSCRRTKTLWTVKRKEKSAAC